MQCAGEGMLEVPPVWRGPLNYPPIKTFSPSNSSAVKAFEMSSAASDFGLSVLVRSILDDFLTLRWAGFQRLLFVSE